VTGVSPETTKSGPLTIEGLQEEINVLREQLKKNTKVVLNTGEQLLSMQLEKQRSGLANLDIKSSNTQPANVSGPSSTGASTAVTAATAPTEDAPLTQADVVELVEELQGQLDMLDERSIRRTANAFVAQDTDAIAPLPGRDGQAPTVEDGFPKNLKQFKELDADGIESLSRYYELLPPDDDEINELLANIGATREEIDVKAPSKEYTREQIDDQFDVLARFLGLRVRRAKGAW
jgi:hypothetical protein